MDNNTPQKSIHERVLERIKGGEVSMHSHWYFVLRGALLAVGIIALALTVFFIFSFIIFALRVSGVWFMPVFGWRGFGEFIWSLPWLLIVVSLVFIIILEILTRHYALAYRQPLLYSALFIIAIAALGSVAFAQLPLHRSFLLKANENKLPVAGFLYRGFALQEQEHIYPGVVREMASDGFQLQTRRQEILRVLITQDAKLPYEKITVGNFVIVFGERDEGVVRAMGVRLLDSETWEHGPGFGRHMMTSPPSYQPFPTMPMQ